MLLFWRSPFGRRIRSMNGQKKKQETIEIRCNTADRSKLFDNNTWRRKNLRWWTELGNGQIRWELWIAQQEVFINLLFVSSLLSTRRPRYDLKTKIHKIRLWLLFSINFTSFLPHLFRSLLFFVCPGWRFAKSIIWKRNLNNLYYHCRFSQQSRHRSIGWLLLSCVGEWKIADNRGRKERQWQSC